jgi:DNA-binding NarL/FixJ family response regulator
LRRMIFTDYMIADCNKKRCSLLQKRINLYRSANCVGSFGKEVELLEKTWIEHPEVVLVYAGDQKLNAYSVLKRIKEVTPDVKVVFYSEQNDYAMDAYEKGADYFLPLPVDDIKIGKLVFRYIGN